MTPGSLAIITRGVPENIGRLVTIVGYTTDDPRRVNVRPLSRAPLWSAVVRAWVPEGPILMRSLCVLRALEKKV